jgi:hypothetical protein
LDVPSVGARPFSGDTIPVVQVSMEYACMIGPPVFAMLVFGLLSMTQIAIAGRLEHRASPTSVGSNGHPFTDTKTTVAPVIGLKHEPVENNRQVPGSGYGVHRNAIGVIIEKDKNKVQVPATLKVVKTNGQSTNGTSMIRPGYGAGMIRSPGKIGVSGLSGNTFPRKHP